jgi:hypothetical protein
MMKIQSVASIVAPQSSAALPDLRLGAGTEDRIGPAA